jgi:hypothetical protein
MPHLKMRNSKTIWVNPAVLMKPRIFCDLTLSFGEELATFRNIVHYFGLQDQAVEEKCQICCLLKKSEKLAQQHSVTSPGTWNFARNSFWQKRFFRTTAVLLA